jgi:hypothetical protein
LNKAPLWNSTPNPPAHSVELILGQARDLTTFEPDAARVRPLQTDELAQRGALAATAAPMMTRMSPRRTRKLMPSSIAAAIVNLDDVLDNDDVVGTDGPDFGCGSSEVSKSRRPWFRENRTTP